MISIALPSGSLESETLRLFEEANLGVSREPRAQRVSIQHPDISQVLIAHPRRIPRLVEEGLYDVGICGWDCVVEASASVVPVTKLAYSRATTGNTDVVLFGAIDDPIKSASEIPPGSMISSEYPKCTRRFFQELGIQVNIDESRGTTEAEVPKKYRFGVGISETGDNLKANDQRVIEILFESATTLIANQEAMNDPYKKEIIHALELLLVGTLEARERVLLFMNVSGDAKEAVLARLPSLASPTISELASGDGFAINTVAPLDGINVLIPDLLRLGAEGLLQMPISKIIPKW